MLASPNVSAPASASQVERLNFTALPPQHPDTAVLSLPVQRATEAVTEAIDADALVTSHLHLAGLAVNMATKRLPPHHPYLDHQDLEQVATLALMRCAKRYDPTCGASFATYAMRRLPGAVVDAMRENDWAGRAMREKARAWTKAQEVLTASLDREPTVDETADYLGVTSDAIRALHFDMARTRVESIDVLGMPDTPAREETPEELLLRGEQAEFIRAAIEALPVQHARVVTGIFFDDETKVSLGKKMGVSSSRVHKILNEAMRLLWAGLSELHLGETSLAPDHLHPTVRKHDSYYQRMTETMRGVYPRPEVGDPDSFGGQHLTVPMPLTIPTQRFVKEDYSLTA